MRGFAIGVATAMVYLGIGCGVAVVVDERRTIRGAAPISDSDETALVAFWPVYLVGAATIAAYHVVGVP